MPIKKINFSYKYCLNWPDSIEFGLIQPKPGETYGRRAAEPRVGTGCDPSRINACMAYVLCSLKIRFCVVYFLQLLQKSQLTRLTLSMLLQLFKRHGEQFFESRKNHVDLWKEKSIYTKVDCKPLKDLTAHVDPGAVASLVDDKFVKRAELENKPYCGVTLNAADNQPLNISGQVSTQIEMNVNGVKTKVACKPVVIEHMPEGVDILLGMDTLKQTPYLVDLA